MALVLGLKPQALVSINGGQKKREEGAPIDRNKCVAKTWIHVNKFKLLNATIGFDNSFSLTLGCRVYMYILAVSNMIYNLIVDNISNA